MKNEHQRNTLHVVIGPTASGKSEFAVKLAKKYNGEIISVDSRQVYKGLNIGTGKVNGSWDKKNTSYTYKNIRHHCIDFVSPKRQYTVTDFKQDAAEALQNITERHKTPILCGGTGQYVDALLLNLQIPEVPPNEKLRKRLERKPVEKLYAELLKKDPIRAASIDPQNPRRLIRALEIIDALGAVPALRHNGSLTTYTQQGLHLPIKIYYLKPPRTTLYAKIEKRLRQRVHEGMVTEVIKLHQNGLTWKRMVELGLEYRFIATYLQRKSPTNKNTKTHAQTTREFLLSTEYTGLLTEIKRYAKRQETWFKKYASIKKSTRHN
jgi:tRNA dimethylallyltransferase